MPPEGGQYAPWLRRSCREILSAEGPLLEETIGIDNRMMTPANAYYFATLGCTSARALCDPFDDEQAGLKTGRKSRGRKEKAKAKEETRAKAKAKAKAKEKGKAKGGTRAKAKGKAKGSLSRCEQCKAVAWFLRDQLRQRRGEPEYGSKIHIWQVSDDGWDSCPPPPASHPPIISRVATGRAMGAVLMHPTRPPRTPR